MIIPSINWEYCERETKISKTIRKVSLQISKTSVKKILEDKKFIYSQIIFDFVRESIASYVVLTNLFKNFVNLIIPHEENIKTMNECYYFRSPQCLSIICCFSGWSCLCSWIFSQIWPWSHKCSEKKNKCHSNYRRCQTST